MYILIAGGTGVGKTTIARALAVHMDCQVISTTDIRTVLRTVVASETNPELFLSTYQLNDIIQKRGSPVAEAFLKQARLVDRAVAAVLERYRTSNCIAEGVHLLPLICEYLPHKDILPIVIRQPSREEHRARIASRASGDPGKPLEMYDPFFESVREIGSLVESSWLSIDWKGKLCVLDSESSINERVAAAVKRVEESSGLH